MLTATFRFHGELNDFLPAARRNRAFEAPCARAATTKHMIEALGAPHTEVGRVLVNDEDAGLERLLQQGDSVDVHPGGEMPDMRPQFVADAHVGGLARLLRMAGFDTVYDNHFHDAEIAEIAASQQRVVLTRDRDLLIRREIRYGRYLRALPAEAQLAEVIARYRLAAHARPFSLCLHCNAPLHPVAKADIEQRLPPLVRAHYDEFSGCDICGRVFWKGSHWKRMAALLSRVLAEDAEGRAGPA
jgi:uncharacterized protein with PIN domain